MATGQGGVSMLECRIEQHTKEEEEESNPYCVVAFSVVLSVVFHSNKLMQHCMTHL